MINDKKIEEAAVKSANYLKGICNFTVINAFEEGFKKGAKWGINELLNGLFHPANEVPRNDNGKVLAFSKVNSNMKAILNENACYTYKEKQEIRVREYTFTDLLFVEDLLDLIKKGGNHG